MTIEPRMEDLHLTTDALIISAAVGDYRMRRILVDTGSSEDIIYEHCFNRMQPEDRKLLESVHAPIKGFTGEKVDPIGQITFPVTFGQSPRERTILLTFLVVRAESYHNMIIGRFTLGKLDAIVSTARGFMKFPTPRGIATVFRDKIGEVLSTKRCRQGPTGATGPERWVLSTRHPDQMVTIGDTLSPEIRNDLKQWLRRNVDIFDFEHSDMTGVPRDKAKHRLATLPGIKSVAQGKRSMAPDRRAAVVKEVRKLVEAGILRETQYHTWVSNPVMVKTPDGTWRMCIDFKDLNKACPKDAYPLPEIDLKVDSLVPYRFKCFLDAYKGYHQIKMSKEDEEKTAFHTDVGIFCYTKMPFGLRNAGATYQRLMDKVFETQFGRNLEVYVDDLVIKSREEKQMLADIEETFQRLREYNIKLNPKKCSFGVEEGKFLGVVVTRDGFKANPEKVAAIARMPSPRTLKEAQALNGRLVAINRFLARHAEKSLPFIKTLKDCLNKKNIKWTNEAEQALQDMKRFIEGLPMLAAPRPNEVLKMYLAAAHTTVSAVLMVERDGRQTPIYYISRVLAGPETRYPTLEKLVLALVHATRRLRRYFQAHRVQVLTNYPLQQVLHKPEISGRLAKWAIEHGALDIEYQKRTAVKGQVIADFLAEIPEGEAIVDPVVQDIPESSTARQTWKLYTDGSSSGKGSGAGLMVISPDEIRLMYALRFDFECSNNEAEYEALLAGLRMAKSMGAARVEAYVDSLLVNNQVNETYEARDESMAKYLAKTKELMDSFDNVTLNHVHRGKNQIADALSKLATSGMEKEVKVETLQTPSIEPRNVSAVTAEDPCWYTPVLRFLETGELPPAKGEAQKIQTKALQYEINNGVLYRKSYLGPLLRCVSPTEAKYLISEIHAGLCGIHAGPRAVVAKIHSAGYYWPGMHEDAVIELRKYRSCQKFAPQTIRPKNSLVPVTTAWPFQKWAVDIVGPFPPAPGKLKYLIVAVDYFTKWVEAKPLAKITGDNAKKILWEHIVCRFGLPLYLVSDNGTQFTDRIFQEWCTNLHIQQIFTSVAHPQGNGQVERTNRSLLDGIKKRLGHEGSSWVEELPNVLWAHRTMPKTSNNETPFSLTYGAEAMIPAEAGLPSLRRLNTGDDNDRSLREGLDLLEERREAAAISEAKYKKALEKYYNKRVAKQNFKTGDYVMRDNEASRMEPSGKLGPNWEGPYVIQEDLGKGAYRLSRLDGTPVPRSWNIAQLRKCYL
ncbi:protein NYNRIN-like [Helianthus annuus]|uniref:protein NYNRIN-like n=1 Tax=Helianthus annuus TaxID=4232 RepID=UPI000B907B11|nr:protein NYNRIN-like [Helianthus annuus]